MLLLCACTDDRGSSAVTADAEAGRAFAAEHCAACHATDGRGKTSEIPNLAAQNAEYLIESIFNPAAYVLPGDWEEAMPDTFHVRITDAELANIFAWIQSLE